MQLTTASYPVESRDNLPFKRVVDNTMKADNYFNNHLIPNERDSRDSKVSLKLGD